MVTRIPAIYSVWPATILGEWKDGGTKDRDTRQAGVQTVDGATHRLLQQAVQEPGKGED